MVIKPLDENLVHRANSNSFGGTRGDGSKLDYIYYANEIICWQISDVKKQQILDILYKKCSEKLKYEAQHVSVAVAGGYNYNAKRLDKGDKILQLSSEFVDWFKGLEEQVNSKAVDKSATEIRMIEFCETTNDCDPTKHLEKLAMLDNTKFIEFYERLQPKYQWRKNSKIYKLYQQSVAGDVKEIMQVPVFTDGNLTAYTEGERAYINFIMKPQRQIITALKSRGYWWNTHAKAWGTYINKFDVEWVKTISEKYEKYL